MKVYHYNTKKFNEILTRDLQGLLTEEEKKADQDGANYRDEIGPYSESASFFLEPLPIKHIASIFPKDHKIWIKGNKLVEHVIDIKDIDLYGWAILEGPITMFFIDNVPWSDNVIYKKLFFKSLQFSRKLFNESGKNFKSLKKSLDNIPQGTTEKAYMKMPERDDYEEIKYLYAGSVPHLMVYTKSPIPVLTTKTVTVDDQPFPKKDILSLENKLPSLNW